MYRMYSSRELWGKVRTMYRMYTEISALTAVRRRSMVATEKSTKGACGESHEQWDVVGRCWGVQLCGLSAKGPCHMPPSSTS